jgi:hypothetical protein
MSKAVSAVAITLTKAVASAINADSVRSSRLGRVPPRIHGSAIMARTPTDPTISFGRGQTP